MFSDPENTILLGGWTTFNGGVSYGHSNWEFKERQSTSSQPFDGLPVKCAQTLSLGGLSVYCQNSFHFRDMLFSRTRPMLVA
jgi:hypothetical protein